MVFKGVVITAIAETVTSHMSPVLYSSEPVECHSKNYFGYKVDIEFVRDCCLRPS